MFCILYINWIMDNKSDNNNYFNPAIYIYTIGIIFTFIYYYYLFYLDTNQNFILINLIIVVIILLLNGYFSYHDPLKDFDDEIAQYSYVELNARVLLTAALAVAFFFHYIGVINKGATIEQKKSILWPFVFSFFYACLILTIIWMPKHDGVYIRILRDIKTIFLTLSISSIIISMINIMYFSV